MLLPFDPAVMFFGIYTKELKTYVHITQRHGLDHECFSQFSRSVVSESLRPHESQHARPPCPSPTPGVYPNSCPLSR